MSPRTKSLASQDVVQVLMRMETASRLNPSTLRCKVAVFAVNRSQAQACVKKNCYRPSKAGKSLAASERSLCLSLGLRLANAAARFHIVHCKAQTVHDTMQARVALSHVELGRAASCAETKLSIGCSCAMFACDKTGNPRDKAVWAFVFISAVAFWVALLYALREQVQHEIRNRQWKLKAVCTWAR